MSISRLPRVLLFCSKILNRNIWEHTWLIIKMNNNKILEVWLHEQMLTDCIRSTMHAKVCMSLDKQKWQCQVFMDTCETILKWHVTMAMGKWIPAKAWVRLHESKEAFEFHVTVHWHSHAPQICKERCKTQ